MVDFVPDERATAIRVPSTAILAVDSSDRRVDLSSNYIDPVWDFTINRPQSVLNGFFTRIGLTELAIRWDTPNISSRLGNNTLNMEISGNPAIAINMTFPNQFCINAACIFDGIIKYVNDLSGTTNFYLTMVDGLSGAPGMNPLRPCTYQLRGNNIAPGTNGGFFKFLDTPLARQLNIFAPGLYGANNYTTYYEPTSPDLRPFYFIDFISPNLTYNQSLKDTSTNPNNVDILTRFYFSYEEENTYDKYNYPILMGYRPFVTKVQYNPPKQIRWTADQPIGQIQFQVYGEPTPQVPRQNSNYGLITLPSYLTDYEFTLQVSEV